MIKKLTLFTALLFSFLISQAQVSGDYRSNVATGNWSDPLSWQTYNGATWVAAGTAPAAANNVYIQVGHIITVDVASACNNLNLNNTAAARLALGANTLQVNGKLRAYSGAVNTIPGTNGTPPGSAAWIASTTGKIEIVGSSRSITLAGEWGATNAGAASPNGFDLEINLTAGQTATALAAIKARSVTITAGTLQMGSASAVDLQIDNGTAGASTLSIASGATLNMNGGGNIQRIATAGATSHFGTLNLQSGGFLTYSNTTVGAVGAGTITLNGTVSYTASGAQTMASRGSNSAGVQPGTVNNLVISGSGIKTMGTNTTVTGLLSIATGCTLATSTTATTLSISGTYSNSGTLTATAAASSVVLNGGIAQTLDLGTHSILQLNVDNASGVALTTTNLNITGTAANCLLLTAGVLDISAISATVNGGISVVAGSITGSCTTDFTITGGTATAVTIPLITNGLRNLNLTKTVATNITSGANLSLCGNLNINASNTYILAATVVTVNGNVSNSGTVTATTGKILLSGGGGPHTLGGATSSWANVELDDTQGATFNGGGTSTLTTLTITSGELTLNNFSTALTVTSATSVTGTLTFGTGTTGARTLGATTINNGGVINVTNAPLGVLTLASLNIVSGGNWNNSSNKAVTVNGNITSNSATKTEGTGTYTIGAASIISGAEPLNFTNLTVNAATTNQLNLTVSGILTVAAGITLTNQSTLNATGTAAIAGTGTINNSTAASVFNLASASIGPALTATAVGNTVHYNSSTQNQTVKNVTYRKLIITKPGFVAQSAGTMTVQESIDIQAGTLYDNGSQITVTAATTLNMEPATTLQLGAGTATVFPALFTLVNLTLEAGSTINYSATVAQNVSNLPAYQNVLFTGNSIKTLQTGAMTVNGDFTINGGSFYNGGFQVNGTAAGNLSMAAGTTMRIGAASGTISLFPTGFVTAKISLAQNSTVDYNTITNPQTVSSAPPAYGNLTITGGSGTKTANGDIVVAGNFSIATAGGIYNDGGFTTTVNGTLNNAGSHQGSGKIEITGGGGLHTMTGTGPYTNLELNDGSFDANMGANFAINGELTLTSGNLLINTRTLTLNGTVSTTGGFLSGTTSSTLLLTGATAGSMGNLAFASGGQLLSVFTINRTGAGASCTVESNVSVTTLNLTAGDIDNTGYTISVTGTTVSSVTNSGGANSYVTGALQRRLPQNLTAAATYIFPVGKSNYQLFELLNPTTANVVGLVDIKAEVFDADAGGTAGFGVGTMNTDHYWKAEVIANAANFTSAGLVRLTESGLTNGTDHICNSTDALPNGTYYLLGSSCGPTNINTQAAAPTTLGYYVIGRAGNVSGTVTVGTGGTLRSLTNAGGLFDVLSNATFTGNVTADIVSDMTSESGAYALKQWNEFPVASNFTLKIQPQAGTAVIRTLAGNYNGNAISNAGLFRLEGADRVTIDGREPVTNAGRWLEFRNINATASSNFNSTFTFVNDAQDNTITYCEVEGATVGATNGVIYFATSGGTTLAGNDNNTISNCIIKNAGATNTTLLPTTGILSNGTNTAGRENSNITIADNEIYDFFVSGNTCTGVRCAGAARGNEDWTITGNSIYQTTSRNFGSGDFRGISIEHTANTDFNISGNYIGGTAANCGGSALTLAGAPIFMGIRVSASNTTPATEIDGNIIRNIYVSTSSISTAQGGISVTQGAANIGVNTPNEIGSSTVANSIEFSITGVSAQVNGISCGTGGAGAYDIRNNTIGGIQINGTTGIALRGIAITTNIPTALNVEGNVIGSTTQTNNITQNTNGSVYGIQYTVATNNAFAFKDNTIANLKIANIGTSAQFIGISVGGGANTISGNQIYNIESNAAITTSGATAGMIGISNTSASTAGQSITANSVHSINFTGSVLAAAKQTGIYMGTAASGTNTVAGNMLSSFDTRSDVVSAEQTGIEIGGTTNANLYNNIIRLGVDNSGSSLNKSIIITGILDASTGANKVYHNTVVVAGALVAGSSVNTYGFRRTAATGADDIRNNIISNFRTGGSNPSYHFALALNTVVAGSTIDYNVYSSAANTFFSTAATPLPLTGASSARQLQNLRNSIGNLNSGCATVAQINFVSAADASQATLDLHLNNATCASDAGVDLSATVAGDFDASSGRSTTPDIGADEGAFDSPIAAANDVYSPLFSFTPITNQASCSGGSSATVNVTVNDLGVGLSTSSNQPRMYIRKSTGSAPGTTWSNSQLFTGSFVSGTANSSVWQFTIDYAALGITADASDEFEYYFTATDQATTPNIWYSTFNATTPVHSAVDNFTVAQAGTFTLGVNRYSIIVPLSGTVTVGGTGGATYTTLTGASGLFIDLFNKGLSDDLDVKIRSNTTETGTYFLYAPTQYCGTGHKITITPETGSTKTLSGSLIGLGLFGFSGVDDVTIDGSFGGSGKYLTFSNTYAGAGGSVNSTLYFENHATGNTIKNCVINGATQKTGGGIITLYVSSGAGAGNSNNTFDNNTISGLSWASKCIYSVGSAGSPNSGNTFTNNEIANFRIAGGGNANRSYGIHIDATGNGSNWTISGNSIYNSAENNQNVQSGLAFLAGSASNNNVISGNYIGGSSAMCGTGGSITTWKQSWRDHALLNLFKAVDVNAGTIDITGNTITNIWCSNSNNDIAVCVDIAGSTIPNIDGNIFGSDDFATDIENSGGTNYWGSSPGIIYGIRSTTSGMLTATDNTFHYMVANGSGWGGSMRTIYHTGSGVSKINYNTMIGPQASGIDEDSWGIYLSPSAATTGNEIIGNVIAGPYISNSTNGAGSLGWMENMAVYVAGNTGILIKDNEIYDVRNASTDGSSYGIRLLGTGTRQVINNQISLENVLVPTGNGTNPSSLYGIRDEMTSAGTVEYLFNSIHIGGSCTAGVDWVPESYAYDRYPNMTGNVAGAKVRFKNNIFMNSRSGGGVSSRHAAISNYSNSGTQTANWDADSSDYNFMASRNASIVGVWGSSAYSFTDWKTQSNGDKNSYSVLSTTGATSATQVNGSDLFLNTRLGILTPDSTKQASWFVNGKGVAGTLSGSVAADARGLSRTTTYGFGVNIGAVENHAATGVLPFDITATPSLGGTNTFSFAGRQFGSITWNNTGTVPTSILARYYTGDFPGTAPSPAYSYTDGTDFMVQYVPTGGSGYRYNTTLNYDEALRGTFVANESVMEMVKTDNPTNAWGTVPFSVDVNANTLTSTSGIAEFSFFGGGLGVPLPVTLISFDANCVNSEVELQWQTALEINNDYFTIERSANGVDFTPVAEIDGAGNSTTTLNYIWKDRDAEAGINYYRLKQTDFDGQYEYFNTVAAGCNVTTQGVTVYPNPANNNITISFSTSSNALYDLKVYDLTGKLVIADKLNAVKGLQSRTLDVSVLSSGIYMLSLENENGSTRFKFTKQGN